MEPTEAAISYPLLGGEISKPLSTLPCCQLPRAPRREFAVSGSALEALGCAERVQPETHRTLWREDIRCRRGQCLNVALGATSAAVGLGMAAWGSWRRRVGEVGGIGVPWGSQDVQAVPV